MDKIPLAGEYIAAPAAELAYNLGQDTLRIGAHLMPDEILFMAGTSETMLKGSGPIVKAALEAIKCDSDARMVEVSQKMNGKASSDLIGLIAQCF